MLLTEVSYGVKEAVVSNLGKAAAGSLVRGVYFDYRLLSLIVGPKGRGGKKGGLKIVKCSLV